MNLGFVMFDHRKQEGIRNIYIVLISSLISYFRLNNTYNKTNFDTMRTNFETNIADYLTRKGLVRREELVKYLQEKHKGEVGYSKASVERKLSDLVNEGFLTKLDHKEVAKFGIKEDDKRASYLTLKHSFDVKKHLDQVFSLLETGDVVDRKMALKEVEIYNQRYVLTPNQLDILIQNLDSDDLDFVDSLVRVLNNEVLKKGVEPANEKIFVKKLRDLLKKHPEPIKGHVNMRTYIICLLGHYNDPIVIERLTKDVSEMENPDAVKNDYWHEHTARLIENHRTELFDLERQLRKDNKEKGAQLINEIRFRALSLLGMAEGFKTKEVSVDEVSTVKRTWNHL